MTDWGYMFLAAVVGFCLGWMLNSLWSIRWIDAERRKIHETVDPVVEQMHIELERLRLQERFNRERA